MRTRALFLSAVLLAGCGTDMLSPTHLSSASAAARAAVSSLTTTSVSAFQINLAWPDNSNNETGWEVHRSTNGAAGTFTLRATTGSNVTNYSDVGLTALSQYCYRVRWFRTSGKNTNYGAFSDMSCAETPGPPPAPSGADAKPANSSAVDVSWTDNSQYDDGFRVERSGAATGPWQLAATTSPSATAYRDEGRASEQQVCYRVMAFNANGTSAPSNADCTTPPAGPVALTATAGVNHRIDVTWIDNSVIEDAYQVQRAEAEAGPYHTVATLAANSTSHEDYPSAGNTTFWYRVRAKKDGGFSDFSNAGSATTDNCFEGPERVCDDGADNDCDGFMDAADPDCAVGERCTGPEKLCNNFDDDDCDGLVDGADPDCPAPPCDMGCPPGMMCYPDGFCYYSSDSDAGTDLDDGDYCPDPGVDL